MMNWTTGGFECVTGLHCVIPVTYSKPLLCIPVKVNYTEFNEFLANPEKFINNPSYNGSESIILCLILFLILFSLVLQVIIYFLYYLFF